MEKKKFFIGAPIDIVIQNHLYEIIRSYNDPIFRWTKPDNLHLTFCFIGYTCATSKQISEKIYSLTAKGFHMQLKEIIPIFRKGRANMIWLTFYPEAAFGSLAGQLNELLNIKMEREPTAHVTLCRIKEHHSSSFHFPPIILKKPMLMKINSIVLYESKSINNERVYIPIEDFKLK